MSWSSSLKTGNPQKTNSPPLLPPFGASKNTSNIQSPPVRPQLALLGSRLQTLRLRSRANLGSSQLGSCRRNKGTSARPPSATERLLFTHGKPRRRKKRKRGGKDSWGGGGDLELFPRLCSCFSCLWFVSGGKEVTRIDKDTLNPERKGTPRKTTKAVLCRRPLQNDEKGLGGSQPGCGECLALLSFQTAPRGCGCFPCASP